jgi:hypothetical protein
MPRQKKLLKIRAFRRDLSYLKPPKFQDYFTLSELCEAVNKKPDWIRELENNGRIPRAVRVRRGKVDVRLWSPAQVEEIRKILKTHKVGRPRTR